MSAVCASAAATIAVSAGAGAVLGLATGMFFGPALVKVGWKRRLQVGFDTLAAVIGIVLFLQGLKRHSRGNLIWGLILVVSSVAYLATTTRGAFAALYGLVAAVFFVAIAIISWDPLWLIAAALMGAAAVGFYVRRRDEIAPPSQ